MATEIELPVSSSVPPEFPPEQRALFCEVLEHLNRANVPYVVSGALSAIAATLMSAQILSIDPLAGTGLELDAIAAVVIGGASLYGGRGTIIGTLIGVFIMVMIRNGLNLLGVSPFWQGSAIGAIIIAAVLAERLLSPRTRR